MELDTLGIIAWYNGHSEEIEEIIKYIENYEGKYNIPMPEFLRNNDCDYFMNILWQISVLTYGDYGTSPRFGWLEIENKEKILKMWTHWFELSKGE